MTIIEAIEKRKSNRNYTGEPLLMEHVDLINDYIAELKTPFGAPPVVNIILIISFKYL